ncbi:MAG: hypothetical protein HYV60_17925 [Planctomycetia bacterium]|nr:hypothetical protein [Planctomycetia bacterium]
MSPKLIVLVGLSLDEASPDSRREPLVSMQRSLRTRLLAPGQPPTLVLDAANGDWNEEEVVAAIFAMQH